LDCEALFGVDHLSDFSESDVYSGEYPRMLCYFNIQLEPALCESPPCYCYP